MTPQERAPYIGSSSKPTISNSSFTREAMKRYTSFGVSFDEIDRKEDLQQKAIATLNLTIEEMLHKAIEMSRELCIWLF